MLLVFLNLCPSGCKIVSQFCFNSLLPWLVVRLDIFSYIYWKEHYFCCIFSLQLPTYSVFPIPSFPLGDVIVLFLGYEFIYLNRKGVVKPCPLQLLYPHLCCQFSQDSFPVVAFSFVILVWILFKKAFLLHLVQNVSSAEIEIRVIYRSEYVNLYSSFLFLKFVIIYQWKSLLFLYPIEKD